MALSAFSEDGKYYSSISKDGRLKIWDTETNVLKQEYTPDLHLTSPPSCLQWLYIASSPKSSHEGVKKPTYNEKEIQCIALGTTSGKILIYSVTQAKIENVISDQISEKKYITALDWHRKYGLYSSYKAGFVLEWNLKSGSVKNKYNVVVDKKTVQGNSVNAIKIVPHDLQSEDKFLIAASWQLCMWRLHDGEATIFRHLGHKATSGAILSIVSLRKASFLVEGSQKERLLSFWDITVEEPHLSQVNGDGITPRKRHRKQTYTPHQLDTPNYNFVLEDAPKFFDVQVKQEEDMCMLKMVAATRSGVVHYYGHTLNGASTKPHKPTLTLQVASSNAHPRQLMCCRLVSDHLLLGYSLESALIFEKIRPDLSSKTQVLIRDDPNAPIHKERINEVNKVRADEPQPSEVTYVAPHGLVDRKRHVPGGKVEVPMEVRLENLSLDTKSRSTMAVNQNFTKLLIQGLHSKDKNLILSVLQNNDEKVAACTVAKLPAEYVPMLIDQLVDMAARKTSQCVCACTWAWAAVRAHAALLLAAEPPRLARLLPALAHRRSHLCQLLNLQGRLKLTVAQRVKRQEDTEQAPVLTYNDDTSEEEMEVEKHSSSASEQSWSDQEAASDVDE